MQYASWYYSVFEKSFPQMGACRLQKAFFKHALENLLDYRWILKLTVAHR